MADNGSSSPDSDRSVYFDAPLAPFVNMSSAPENAAGPSGDKPPADPHDVIERGDGDGESSLGWLPATDQPPETTKGVKSPSPTGVRRSVSRRSLFTDHEGQPLDGPMFLGGASTTGPHAHAQPHEELTERSANADASLSRKDRSRIAKAEARDGKLLSKIIKDEGRAEKESLATAINELAGYQKIQARAIKSEATANASRSKVHAEFQKQEAVYLAARTQFEAVQARLTSEDERVEVVRNNARDAAEKLQEKNQEVNGLRVMYGVDERERAARLAAISGRVNDAQPRGGNCVIA
ncbi:hypothetical protein DXG03_001663 [Asterophora parasitica]|uniref:Uncharacterized protein n=1 Tax=Asterophora parasitica TaxID=117018 RepID=A0A9P7GCQ5_9AGAR|nr:hypothetical protein DXG03_001663 [Asterophora parasitica]